MRRWRAVEQVERLTTLLREHESLPRGFYDLLRERGVDPREAALADLVEDQGCNLSGVLLTTEGRVIRFDIDFHGEGYGRWDAWGGIEAIQEWQESRLADRWPRQGTSLEVAMRLLREGRL